MRCPAVGAHWAAAQARKSDKPINIEFLLIVSLLLRMGDTSVILEATGKHTGTILFLHGLGDVGESWADALSDLRQLLPHVRIICPTAPQSRVTINGGARMTSWHDIRSLQAIDDEGKEQFSGVEESVAIVKAIIESEIQAGIPANRIVLGGFSQGAALSVRTGFTLDVTLAGVVCLSGYLVQKSVTLAALNDASKATPLFVGHGTADAVVAFDAGKRVHAALSEAGVTAELHVYERMGHSSSQREMQDLAEFFASVLPRIGEKSELK